MTLTIRDLPPIIFLGRDSSERLDLSAAGGAVGARAEALRDRFAPGARIGLIHRTGPELILCWLACLDAGLVPTILQYPTIKQSAGYWRDSIAHVNAACDLAAILIGPELERLQLPPSLGALVLEPKADAPEAGVLDGSIIQMSSGTTGHRKALQFSLDQIAAHARRYNEVLQMTAADRVVSWLPLYHDMGFIACFAIPLLVGAPILMIDPQEWVQQPGLLFRAIAEFGGSLCYMPNFGFEIMARQGHSAGLESMRRWISCSEPVSPSTFERFMSATGVAASRLSACYAMAENVFAISQSDGLGIIDVGGVRYASCGPAIPGTEIKLVDGEIWARSETSVVAYLDGEPVVDADGFYATGDLGLMVDQELVVRGRVRDIIVQAGVKHLLSDLEHLAEQLDTSIRGRCCALAVWDQRQGTQRPLLLVERPDFYLRKGEAEFAGRLSEQSSLGEIEVRWAPPHFITKTSSGKVNRIETGKSWAAVDQRQQTGAQQLSIEQELERLFPNMPRDKPVGSLVDSLGSLMIQMVLSERGLVWDPELCLGELIEGAAPAPAASDADTVSIVICADARQFRWLNERDVAAISEIVGAPVRVEQVTAVAAPLLISDLIFRDWFLPGGETLEYEAVTAQLDKIKNASLIIFDDEAEFDNGLGIQPVLSHRLQRAPEADLLCYRWQRYTSRHDRLPITLADLGVLTALERERAFQALRDYLGIPLLRFAFLGSHRSRTGEWEVGQISPANEQGYTQAPPAAVTRKALFDYLSENRSKLRRTSAKASAQSIRLDPDHFCCFYIDQAKLDAVMGRFDSFSFVGPPQSLPYIKKRAEALGKPYRYITYWAPKKLGGPIQLDNEDTDCSLMIGAWGPFASRKPMIQIIGAYEKRIEDGLTADLLDLRPDVHAMKYPFHGYLTAMPDQTYFHAAAVAAEGEDRWRLERPRAGQDISLSAQARPIAGIADSAALRAFDRLPGSEAQPTEEGVKVSTPNGKGSWGAEAKLDRGKAPHGSGAVRIDAWVSVGGLTAALRDVNGRTIVATPLASGETVLRVPELPLADSLLLSNASTTGAPSSALIKALEVFTDGAAPSPAQQAQTPHAKSWFGLGWSRKP